MGSPRVIATSRVLSCGSICPRGSRDDSMIGGSGLEIAIAKDVESRFGALRARVGLSEMAEVVEMIERPSLTRTTHTNGIAKISKLRTL
jgi:hypothetical protein